MTTLLTIAQDAVRDISDFDVPDTVINNDDETAVLLKTQMNRVGRQLAMRYDFEALKVEYTFSTVASTSTYTLPDGFRKMILKSFWDRTNDRMVIGPVNSGRWQYFQSSGVGPAGINRYHRRRAGNIDIYPTPSTADDLVYEYYSKYWCQSADEVGQSQWLADTDTAVLDDDLLLLGLRWRLLMTAGEPYQEEFEEFQDYLDALLTNDDGPSIMNMGSETIHDVNAQLPDTGYGT